MLDVINRFVAAINARDVTELCDLMSDDHLFIDSLGNEFRGSEMMRAGWTAYFNMVPDYSIAIEEAVATSHGAMMRGLATGTYAPDGRLNPDYRWSTPAAWSVTVRDGRIAKWQIYADNEPIRQLMAKAKG